ncbi:MAG: cytochrome c [Thermoanaerobaculia bacterium]
MNRTRNVVLVLVVIVIAGVAIAATLQVRAGISAHDEPTRLERAIALAMRNFAVPAKASEMRSPLQPTAKDLAFGRAHWADHCASCHGNDGKGETEMGRGLYPKPPDMTSGRTQSLTDGELAYIIRNGVRLTGMPAWGEPGTPPQKEDWQLVAFIRHLPRITPEEIQQMEKLNPVTPHELEERKAEEAFLSGGKGAPSDSSGETSASNPRH